MDVPLNPAIRPGYLVYKISRLFVRHSEARLSPLGIGVGQVPVFMALAKVGPMTQKDLAVRCEVEQPTMASLLARMERDGLIQRTVDPEDRRSSQVSLTEAGQQAVPEVRRNLDAINEQAYVGFSEEEMVIFRNMLERMMANLKDFGGEA